MPSQQFLQSWRNPASSMTGNPFYDPKGFNPKQGAESIISQGYQKGIFDPTGQGAALDAIRKYLSMINQGQVRQAGLGADIYAQNDPYYAMYAKQNAEQGGRNNMYPALAQAQYGLASNREDYLRNLFGSYFGGTSLYHNPNGKATNPYLGLIGAGIGAVGNIFAKKQ